jgi:hypothetical protein
MTEKKALKRRVRARMEKTGERYTTARARVVRDAEPEPEFDRRVSDEALVARTGRTWDEWFGALDAWDATARTHTEIARHLREELGMPGWWAQTVTVAYEQARGLRKRHERPDGWSVGATRTVAVPVERLYAAFLDEAQREGWLPGVRLGLRTARENRGARFDWEDGPTRVVVDFTAKGEAKSTVALAHERIPNADDAERRKRFWRERLAELKRVLEP